MALEKLALSSINFCMLLLLSSSCFVCSNLLAQVNTVNHKALEPGDLTCPGGFPTDLTVTNCEFTARDRLKQWINVSITDQAMLGAIVYGTGAQIIRSPEEWPRTWGGYGDRIGVRYTQSAARGTTEYLVGSLLRDDPRHVSYKDDPRTPYGTKIKKLNTGEYEIREYGNLTTTTSQMVWKRIGHAFADSVTVRRSNPYGIGRRLPAVDRFAGITASAYSGYGWYPSAENTAGSTALRAAGAFGSTLVGSFYTEFSPEISLLLKMVTGSGARKKMASE